MINLGVECSLSQLLETGVMHADPHPGNLILTPSDRLAYLDFGLLTFVPPKCSEVRWESQVLTLYMMQTSKAATVTCTWSIHAFSRMICSILATA